MEISLDNDEKIVLELVHEYLDKNRYLDMNKVLSFINSRFKMTSKNISNVGIKQILKSLKSKKFIVKGSKLIREELLDNPKRKRILDYIKSNPCIFFNKILQSLNIGYQTLIWHLEMLLRFNFIKTKQFENHEIYISTNQEFEDHLCNFFLYKEKSNKIINYLKEHDYGISVYELTNNLHMHANTVKKYLQLLENYSIISKVKTSDKILYLLKESFV